MARLDAAAEQVVIRLVYDGPPQSGKTTSLRSLAGSLARRLTTPEEIDGRTLRFDWMDYVGGRFEGYQIRCQIVSVPGQEALAARRRYLLAEADAVIFVADTTHAGLASSLDLLEDLRSGLSRRPGPPTGVVLQANKRDLSEAVPLDEIRRQLGDGDLALVESVASEGESIRHAFVLAVRLALDRVRVLLRTGELPAGPGRIDSPAELLQDMLQAEERDPGSAAGPPGGEGDLAALALREAVAREEEAEPRPPAAARAGKDGTPAPPDSSVPGGFIWPPVEGRSLVHEAEAAGIALEPLPSGGWISRSTDGRWTVQSFAAADYDDLERGRSALLAWAKAHARYAAMLSPGRALVLAESGRGTWRLWQIVRRERSLAELLGEALRDGLSEEVANRLAAVSRLLLRAAGDFPPGLEVSLRTVGLAAKRAVLIEPMPAALEEPARRPPDLHRLLRGELADFLKGARVGPAFDLGRVLLRLGQLSDRGYVSEPFVNLLAESLVQHL